MTCIVGIAAEGHVWIGGDSAAAGDWETRECFNPKVFTVGEILIGYTTSWRMAQILRGHLELPDAPERHPELLESAAPYIMEKVVEEIRIILHKYHWATEEDNKQKGGNLLIGYRGHLFEVGADYGVTEMADEYDAIGCGGPYALGALHATRETGISPEYRVKMALEAAAHMSGGVMPPFYIMCLRPDGTIGLLP